MTKIILMCCNESCSMADDCKRSGLNIDMEESATWYAHTFIEPEAIDYCRYFISKAKIELDYEKNKDIHC